MNRWLRLAIVLSMPLLFSCTRVSLFNSPLETDHQVEVMSLAEGGLLNPGDSVTFLIHSPLEDSEALNLEINLTTAGGVEIWSTQVASPLLNEELELLLPESLLETGQYRLTFIISREEGSGSEKTFDFFYAVGEYGILGIHSYPPTPYPASETILKADLVYPADSDPYLRWRQDGEILAAGFISAGLDEIIWAAPEEAGVYSLEVELFPAQPSGGGQEELVSSVSMTASLYVSTQHILSDNDLSPESSYFSLFHFNGALRDFGVQGKTEDGEPAAGLELVGAPEFVQQDDHFGYRLEPGSSLRYDKTIIPLTAGRLAPFTVTLALVPEEGNAEATLLSMGNADEGFLFSLRFDEEEQLLAVLESPQALTVIPSGIALLPAGKESFVSLSLLPGEESLTASWYLDGQPASSSTVPAPESELPETGSTVIGGEVSIVLTELGVFYRDEQDRPTIDPAVYAAAKERKLGSRLILADGFDGLYAAAPEWIEGAYSLESGLLRLAGGSALTLPAFEPTPEGVGLRIVFASPPPRESMVTTAWEGTEAPFLALSAADSVLADGDAAVLEIMFTETAYTLTTAAGSDSREIPSARPEGAWLFVSLAHPGSPAGETPEDLELEQLLLYHDGRQEPVADTP
jgi:hypothetical protein